MMTTERIEASLLALCGELGRIPEMNGPATSSLARHLHAQLGGRPVEDMTLRELDAFVGVWRARRSALYASLTGAPTRLESAT